MHLEVPDTVAEAISSVVEHVRMAAKK